MQQGSQEWLEFRRSKIGSSDSSVIMELNPWKTPYQLCKQKLEGTEDPMTPAMRRGVEMEPRARELFIAKTGIHVIPDVITSNERPWQIASLDGIDDHGETIVEIKCGNTDLHTKALHGKIPPYYLCQIQHQMSVCNLEKAFYCSFDGIDIHIVEIERDATFIEKMVQKEEIFWKMVMNKEYPEPSDKDYLTIHHERGSILLEEYLELSEKEKRIKERKDNIKEELLSIGPNQNFILKGTKFYQKQNCSYDFKKMKEDGIAVENYKKMSSPYWVINTPKSRTI